MHASNREWMADVKLNHLENFQNASVLDIGGADLDGHTRTYFDDCRYVSVDPINIPTQYVDLRIRGQETEFQPGEFDTLLFMSVFEHDADWRLNLKHNLKWLKKGGLVVICFGAEGNLPHSDPWEIVPHQKFLSYCRKLGVKILDAFFEEERYGNDCPGAYNVLLRKMT